MNWSKQFRALFSCGLFVGFAASCVTYEDLDRRLKSWVGEDADSLAANWGAPAGTYAQKDGTRILTYQSMSVVSSGPRHFAQTYSRHCRVNFFVDAKNAITRATFNGAHDECDRFIDAAHE